MKKKKRSYSWVWLLFLAFLIFIDQLTKYLAYSTKINQDFGWFSFTFVYNTGATFGILKDFGPYLAWLSVMILGAIMYFYDRMPEKSRIFILLVSAGLIGNLLDRIMHGFVIDFINLKVWPVFNIADSLVCIGVAGLVIQLWKQA